MRLGNNIENVHWLKGRVAMATVAATSATVLFSGHTCTLHYMYRCTVQCTQHVHVLCTTGSPAVCPKAPPPQH